MDFWEIPMIANYHTHTTRCHHAIGTEREYVENAIVRGLKHFGFSDHTPQWFPIDYYSTMRMYPEQLTEYCNTINGLKHEYASQIQIHLGLEVEYYPATWKELSMRLQDAGIEYMILGQHNCGNEYDTPHNSIATEDVSQLIAYCNQVITAIETGKFTYIAHPDFINFQGDRKIYETEMRRICKAAIETDTPLELNFLGISSNRNYPNPLFWPIVAEEGCKVIMGMDAHNPGTVINTKPEEIALELVNKWGLDLQQTVPLKPL